MPRKMSTPRIPTVSDLTQLRISDFRFPFVPCFFTCFCCWVAISRLHDVRGYARCRIGFPDVLGRSRRAPHGGIFHGFTFTAPSGMRAPPVLQPRPGPVREEREHEAGEDVYDPVVPQVYRAEDETARERHLKPREPAKVPPGEQDRQERDRAVERGERAVGGQV